MRHAFNRNSVTVKIVILITLWERLFPFQEVRVKICEGINFRGKVMKIEFVSLWQCKTVPVHWLCCSRGSWDMRCAYWSYLTPTKELWCVAQHTHGCAYITHILHICCFEFLLWKFWHWMLWEKLSCAPNFTIWLWRWFKQKQQVPLWELWGQPQINMFSRTNWYSCVLKQLIHGFRCAPIELWIRSMKEA